MYECDVLLKKKIIKEALPRKKRDVFRERERERSLSIQQVRDFVCVNLIGMRVLKFSEVKYSCNSTIVADFVLDFGIWFL